MTGSDNLAHNIVVLDFETTGLSPAQGDRAIEIGAVRLVEGQVVEEFQALMNPGFRVSGFIEHYTGITNAMLSEAESCSTVMARFADFIGDDHLLAHNASFDKKFLDAELMNIGRGYPGRFYCSLLASRRLWQSAENHQLATLIKYIGIQPEGQYHRALFDAQMTAKLWVALLNELRHSFGFQQVSFELCDKLQKTAKKNVFKVLSQLVETTA